MSINPTSFVAVLALILTTAASALVLGSAASPEPAESTAHLGPSAASESTRSEAGASPASSEPDAAVGDDDVAAPVVETTAPVIPLTIVDPALAALLNPDFAGAELPPLSADSATESDSDAPTDSSTADLVSAESLPTAVPSTPATPNRRLVVPPTVIESPEPLVAEALTVETVPASDESGGAF